MPALILALVILAIVAFGVAWFLRANPSGMARVLRIVLLGVGSFGAGALLIFGARFLPGLLPELFGLAGLVIAALIARAVRRRPSGGFSTPGTGQRTEVRTAFLEAWIDHGTGDVGGTILIGRFTARTLDGLNDGELLDFHAECLSDADSRRVLEAYLDRRLGADWRNVRQPPPHGSPPRGPRSDMTREEALAVLGLAEGAREEEIKAAYRRLIQRMHPDVGGSADLAARINRAKDVLLGG
jgi:hypothetical protein